MHQINNVSNDNDADVATIVLIAVTMPVESMMIKITMKRNCQWKSMNSAWIWKLNWISNEF